MKTAARDDEFREFFAHENERLQRFASMLVGDPNEAAELAQEALVRVYKRWGRIREGSPGGLREADRRQPRSQRPPLQQAAPRTPLPTGPDSADSHAGRVEEWLRVSTALAELSPVRRATILLRFYEDMSEHEISMALDRPLGTVKSDIYRALRQLRPLEESQARELK
ncbi:SigE family RNA polymerase sigma factor [soil metagenome]